MTKAAPPPVLSDRALNRATLARQLLLSRSELAPLEAVHHLVGLQAQEPPDPYLALWSRLAGFDPAALSTLLEERAVVRIVVMRGTIHLVTAEDALVLRPLTQPVMDAEIARHPQFAPLLRDVDLTAPLAAAREILAGSPRSNPALRSELAARFPDLDAAALAYAARCKLALVQVPPRGLWGRSGQVTTTTVETWLGRPLVAAPSIDAVARRYLAAFGPATVADLASWSRLTGQREVIDRLRPHLVVFRDERGRELFDVPDAPRPDPDVPAPPRFLPMYDNVLLSHADRRRFVDPDSGLFHVERKIEGSVLHDGRVAATWRRDKGPDGAVTVVVDHLPGLPKRAQSAIAAEGRRALATIAPGATVADVRLVPLG